MIKIYLPMLCFVLLNFSGCATSYLLEKEYPARGKINKGSAISDAFFFTCKTKKCESPKFLIRYKVNSNDINYDKSFPPYYEGYILIQDMEYSSRFFNNLNSLLKEPVKSKITSITVRILRDKRINQGHENHIRVDILFKLPFDRKKYKVDNNSIQSSFHTKGLWYNKEKIPNGTGFFLLGGPTCGGPSGSAKISFINNFDTTLINNTWFPLIENPSTYNFNVIFYENNDDYYRTFLSPFTILFDMLTFPLQAIYLIITRPQACCVFIF